MTLDELVKGVAKLKGQAQRRSGGEGKVPNVCVCCFFHISFFFFFLCCLVVFQGFPGVSMIF